MTKAEDLKARKNGQEWMKDTYGIPLVDRFLLLFGKSTLSVDFEDGIGAAVYSKKRKGKMYITRITIKENSHGK